MTGLAIQYVKVVAQTAAARGESSTSQAGGCAGQTVRGEAGEVVVTHTVVRTAFQVSVVLAREAVVLGVPVTLQARGFAGSARARHRVSERTNRTHTGRWRDGTQHSPVAASEARGRVKVD